jgi:hypothetical protein
MSKATVSNEQRMVKARKTTDYFVEKFIAGIYCAAARNTACLCESARCSIVSERYRQLPASYCTAVLEERWWLDVLASSFWVSSST